MNSINNSLNRTMQPHPASSRIAFQHRQLRPVSLQPSKAATASRSIQNPEPGDRSRQIPPAPRSQRTENHPSIDPMCEGMPGETRPYRGRVKGRVQVRRHASRNDRYRMHLGGY